MITRERKLELNTRRIQKHFEMYCRARGMNTRHWVSKICLSPQVMMEGTSVDKLTAEYTHKLTGKTLLFALRKHRKYTVSNLTI